MNEEKVKEKRRTGKLEKTPGLVNSEKKTMERNSVFQRNKNRTLVGKLFTPKKGAGIKIKDEEMEIDEYFEIEEYTTGD